MKLARIILFPILVLGPLGAILMWADLKASKNAYKSYARDAMSQLHLACDDYYEEYQQLPLGSTTTVDEVQLTTGKGERTVMAVLCARIGNKDGSRKEENFFEGKEAIDGKNGLLRNEEGTYAELFDPWGSPYHILLDYDYNRQLKDPSTREIITDTNILIWSPGPDKKPGTADDIHSWK